ncbi:MAG TPA: serine/threonine-protein kinase [Longimicrobium sp.]|nr:serine/threonine-protein kinase [Longimicrobium sp.]
MYGIAGLLTGRTLAGRYLVEAVIGRGGMGAVYRAVDERLSRPVAVKVVGAVTNDPGEADHLRARFHREARAAAGLRHPNVVQVHDFGTDPELDLDYLVMELLHGEDLAARLMRAGAPPLPVALSILRQAARGLSAGHRAGLVHRDVKPGNLFLEPDGDGVHLRVLDFGIAQVTLGEGDTMTQLTVYGRSPFSPAYASPEQLSGDERITAASDVFSLAAVGYHLVTGTRPFTSADPNRAAAEVTDAVRLLRQRAPALDDATYAVLVRALARTPTERFPDALAMAQALSGGESGSAKRVRSTAAGATPSPAAAAAHPPRGHATPHAPASARHGTTDEHTRVYAPAPQRPPVAQVPVPSVFTPTPRPPEFLRPQQSAPAAPATYAATPPPVQEQHPAKTPGRVRRFFRALWEFIVTTTALAMFVGAWWAAVSGAVQDRPLWMYGGVAATVFCTPFALHRLTGRRGRLAFGVIGSLAATALAWRLTSRAEMDHAIALAAVFGLQVLACFFMSWLTHRRPRNPPSTS